MPSLARTKAQNDGWPKADGEGSTSSSEDDEEEGELDLARLLVPPKRQNSIRSLRRHLHVSQGVTSRVGTRSAHGSMRGREGARELCDEDEDGGEDWRREMWAREGGSSRSRYTRNLGDGRDIMEGFDAVSGAAGAKRRRALPGAWAQ